MMKNAILMVLVIGMAGCNNKQTEKASYDSTAVAVDTTVQAATSGTDDDYKYYLNFNNYLTDKSYDTSVMQIIDSSAAIIINPTGEQIKRMEKEMGEDDLA